MNQGISKLTNNFFSDYFNVPLETLEKYGAFNISLINDLPLFIDPFLLFHSKKAQYQELHREIIKYASFLRDKSSKNGINEGLLKAWFYFSEIKQNWFGYSKIGNKGSGLGKNFAEALNKNLNNIFSNFGQESITKDSHLEKLCLIKDGVGRDLISDFATNLIKSFLLEYTQSFARKYIKPELIKSFIVEKVRFNYETQVWCTEKFDLPVYQDDYILLTPKDLLTKDDSWINRNDLRGDFEAVANSIPNDQLRAQVNNYLLSILPEKPRVKDRNAAVARVFNRFPELIDYYIRYKEDNGDRAVALSDQKVNESEKIYIKQVRDLSELLQKTSNFYKETQGFDSYQEAHNRVSALKDVIENKDGYRLFYINGKPLHREFDLQIMFKLICYGSIFDINSEVNNGRGPVDFKISRGNKDKTLVEFKLASNNKLKKNLKNQVEIYESANNTNKSVKVILYFNDAELERVKKILKELNLNGNKDIVLIDASHDKPSASNA